MKYFKKGKYTHSQIKAEYKRLSKIHHPDTSTGTNESFQELNNEYQIVLLKFKDIADKKGNTKQSINIGNEIKTVSDLIQKYIPEHLQPLANVAAKQLGNLLINEINKRI